MMKKIRIMKKAEGKMEIGYLRVTDKHFMIIKNSEGEFPLYEVEMFTHNKMKWLLPYSLVVADGKIEFWYDITGLQSLEVWFHLQQIRVDQLENLLESVVAGFNESWEYLLQEESLLMRSSLIYTDLETNKHWFCYLPGYSRKENQPLKEFMEALLTMIDYQNKDTVAYLYRLYDLFLHTEGSYMELKNAMEFIRTEREKANVLPNLMIEKAEQSRVSIKNALIEKIQNLVKKSLLESKEFVKKKWNIWSDFSVHRRPPLWESKSEKRKQSNSVNPVTYEIGKAEEPLEKEKLAIMEEKQNFGIVGELIYLGEEKHPSIEVVGTKVTIGNNQNLADVVIEESTISKIHALIEYIGGEYFLEDLNSVYGTFLNGDRLSYRERRKLFSNDVVHFAKVKYRFH